MKKNVRSLTLNRETLRRLEQAEPSLAVGGAQSDAPSCGTTCGPRCLTFAFGCTEICM